MGHVVVLPVLEVFIILMKEQPDASGKGSNQVG